VRLLLDTHALLWWLDGDRRLSPRARRAIADPQNRILVSAASAWEITTKARLGKLPGAIAVAADVALAVESQGFEPLDITLRHAQRAGSLSHSHRDPFDRVLAAQSQLEHLKLVTNDPLLIHFDIDRFW